MSCGLSQKTLKRLCAIVLLYYLCLFLNWFFFRKLIKTRYLLKKMIFYPSCYNLKNTVYILLFFTCVYFSSSKFLSFFLFFFLSVLRIILICFFLPNHEFCNSHIVSCRFYVNSLIAATLFSNFLL